MRYSAFFKIIRYNQSMKTYLVGGAVRDKLLGLPVKERDWVVVGSTPKDMLKAGYKPVGKDFPVFLHPETKEEYALARTERKAGHGYTGFEFYADPNVTLEQDLQRRDLTINAMAEDENGNIIDPYQGQEDLHKGLLRHVSEAFTEDPLRVLRIARFNARFAGQGFHVAPETESLLKIVVKSGELLHLVPERIWAETQKALSENYPCEYFSVLHQCGALEVICPEFKNIFTDDIMQTLQHAVLLSDKITVRFASLCQFITPEATEKLCQHLKTDNDTKKLSLAVSRWHTIYRLAQKNSAEKILELFNALDVWRNPPLFDDFLLACQANINIPQAKEINRFWYHALNQIQDIDTARLAKQYQGKELGDAIAEKRLQQLLSLLN